MNNLILDLDLKDGVLEKEIINVKKLKLIFSDRNAELLRTKAKSDFNSIRSFGNHIDIYLDYPTNWMERWLSSSGNKILHTPDLRSIIEIEFHEKIPKNNNGIQFFGCYIDNYSASKQKYTVRFSNWLLTSPPHHSEKYRDYLIEDLLN
jgi:hypothetical protein